MPIPALAIPITPVRFKELLTKEAGALAACSFPEDFGPPRSDSCAHNAFVRVFTVQRGHIFENPQLVITDFTTFIFGRIKMGPTRIGSTWRIYLESPDWSGYGWGLGEFIAPYEAQLDTLTSAAFAMSDSDRLDKSEKSLVVRPWFDDEQSPMIDISPDTMYRSWGEKSVFGSCKWKTGAFPLRIGDTVVVHCTLRTSTESNRKETVRSFSIAAHEIEKVLAASSWNTDV